MQCLISLWNSLTHSIVGKVQNLSGQSSWDKAEEQIQAGECWSLVPAGHPLELPPLGTHSRGMPGNLAGAELSQQLSLVQVLTQIFLELEISVFLARSTEVGSKFLEGSTETF